MGINRFLKKRTGIPLVLMFFWGFYFFFSPTLHFHPSDIHAHAGELQPHEHASHFHSQELEAIAHALDLHPADEQDDHSRHHSHSSTEHDADESEVKLNNSGVQHKNLTEVSKHRENISYFPIPQNLSHQVKEIVLLEFLPANEPDSFHERSPPHFFV
jgi:hypothetical protein